MDLATRCGARALAARAREELVATGARPGRAQPYLTLVCFLVGNLPLRVV
jgi:hypothetical protein